MSTTHTPEPWTAEEWSCHARTSIRAGDVYVAEFGGTGRHSDDCVVDAARAVACVNACAGIEDPAAALKQAREAINIALLSGPLANGMRDEAAMGALRIALRGLGKG